MTTARIQRLIAREILDSRGMPTVETTAVLSDGTIATAAVPSGASTGEHEALELRDNNPKRYGGKGVLQACTNVQEKILPHVRGMRITDQADIDRCMLELDGTPAKSSLGANAILSVSLACARAGAVATSQPLYRYLRTSYDLALDGYQIPQPMFNIINGGRHADNGLDFQEYMVVPTAARFAERLRMGAEIYAALKKVLHGDRRSTLVGDEGGFAPDVASNREPFTLLEHAIAQTSYRLGKDVWFAFDAAASEFYHPDDRTYRLALDRRTYETDGLVTYYGELLKAYPFLAIEDGLSENDWDGWRHMTASLGGKVALIGDDLFTTDPARLRRGIEERAGNAVLIKPNQIGTLTETIETIMLARTQQYTVVVSHRSGDTTDTFIADLAVAVNAPYLKAGAPARSERLAKYHRLLAIEEELA